VGGNATETQVEKKVLSSSPIMEVSGILWELLEVSGSFWKLPDRSGSC